MIYRLINRLDRIVTALLAPTDFAFGYDFDTPLTDEQPAAAEADIDLYEPVGEYPDLSAASIPGATPRAGTAALTPDPPEASAAASGVLKLRDVLLQCIEEQLVADGDLIDALRAQLAERDQDLHAVRMRCAFLEDQANATRRR